MSAVRALPPTLVALSPGTACSAADVRDLARRIEPLVEAGLEGLLLREPALDDGPLLELARRLRGALEHGWLGLHDRVHLVEPAGADAVHLGWRSLAPREARGLLPEGAGVGFSSHRGDAAAAFEGADYLFLSPLHAVPKPHAGEPLGLDGLARELSARPLPCWALGGVQPADCAGAARAGARGVAVLSGLFAAERPTAALDAYRAACEAEFRP